MQRRTYIATIVDQATMTEIACTTTYAWNSAIRATEKLMRDHARSKETIYHGAKPTVVGGMESPDRQYLRNWTSGDSIITASVWEVL